uniref:(northern house mosquito) hypothetical protein n=1 Tax=Culex pipiens TaxID=7175 RepID=A0A8D8G8Y2_CULPI
MSLLRSGGVDDEKNELDHTRGGLHPSLAAAPYGSSLLAVVGVTDEFCRWWDSRCPWNATSCRSHFGVTACDKSIHQALGTGAVRPGPAGGGPPAPRGPPEAATERQL